jgi:hypothetical protein
MAITDDMAIQIIGLNDLASVDDARQVCETDRAHYPSEFPHGQLLAWERSGPDIEGSVQIDYNITIPTDRFKIICAWAVLDRKGDYRSAAAYLLPLKVPDQASTDQPAR